MEQLLDFLTHGTITNCEETHDGIVITRTVDDSVPTPESAPTTCTISGVTDVTFA